MRIPTVQEYDIRSEGDIEPWLRLIVPDGKINHYCISSGEEVKQLRLFWTLPKSSSVAHATEILPFLGTREEPHVRGQGKRWVGPNLAALALNISSWLADNSVYPQPPDTDGSVAKGWRLSNESCHGYVEFFVEPHWQVFGK